MKKCCVFTGSANASVAEVIPLIAALRHLLAKEGETDHGNTTGCC